jgi:ABC-type dipeptide/oligopeptide/nickel transport system permease subunit
MLFWAQARGAFLNDSWMWWIVPPGLAISLTVLGFTYAGYLLEDLLDPRLRAR